MDHTIDYSHLVLSGEGLVSLNGANLSAFMSSTIQAQSIVRVEAWKTEVRIKMCIYK